MRAATRTIVLLSVSMLAFLGLIFVIGPAQSLAADERLIEMNEREREASEAAKIQRKGSDIPFDDDPTERLELNGLGPANTVNCWPSVGGIIIGNHLSSVDLDYLNLPRFESVPRTYNTTEEDEFCRRLRKVGGKWWKDYGDYQWVTEHRTRPTTSKEKEALLLGWPADGGVWVMREVSYRRFLVMPGRMRILNAHTMEERCKAMEMVGAIYYENPNDCEYVKPLLDEFGESQRRLPGFLNPPEYTFGEAGLDEY